MESIKNGPNPETPSTSSAYWKIIEKTGTVLIAVSLFILIFTYYPIVKEEAKYFVTQGDNATPVLTKEEEARVGENAPAALVPVDEEFGIVIPKIGANAKIIPDVNWEDSAAYQRALTRGVAQARGTSTPDKPGNLFLFAHSGVDFYEALRYNAVFYLIDKLEKGDTMDVFYQGKKYAYTVSEKKTVGAEAVEYVAGDKGKKTLTLMTCWPPGTTLKRLIVIADQVRDN
ncbi:MAG: sortase [Candidatus Moraniibacteriota bacterium]